VKILKTQGQSALVEYEIDGVPYRSLVDVADVGDGMCAAERLRDAPYGIEWDFRLSTLARDTEIALKQQGIWTYADLQEKDRAVIRIATNLLGAAIWDAAKRGCNRR